jgi:hypothetical protein
MQSERSKTVRTVCTNREIEHYTPDQQGTLESLIAHRVKLEGRDGLRQWDPDVAPVCRDWSRDVLDRPSKVRD